MQASGDSGRQDGDVRRLLQQQDAERAQRNQQNLIDYHVAAFGPDVGPQLALTTGTDRHLAILRFRGAL